jgi:hypothetical protein
MFFSTPRQLRFFITSDFDQKEYSKPKVLKEEGCLQKKASIKKPSVF